MDEQRYKIKRDIARRIKALHIVFTLLAACFLVHIILFVFCSPKVANGFEELRDSIIIYDKVVQAHRGNIYDRNGKTLATSITQTTLTIDFGSERFDNFEKYKHDADTLSRVLAEHFGDYSAAEYYDKLITYRKKAIKQRDEVVERKPKRWQFWKKVEYDTITKVISRKHISRRIFRDVDQNEWNYLRQFPLLRNGMDITYRTKDHDFRVYPQGNLALRTIGRIDRHNPYGVEAVMRDTLAGKNGLQMMQIITPGYSTRLDDRRNVKAQAGYDVVTTLDIELQDIANSALRDQLIEQNAFWGTTVVMECATGDILAMANLKRVGSECVENQNYAIEVPINPGSTFKLVSAMALLENGVPTKKIYNSGLGETVKVGGKVGANVTDSHPIGTKTGGDINMRTAFAESANVYFTTAVFECFRNNPAAFTDLCYKLHLNKKVGLADFGAVARKIEPLDKTHKSRYNALVNMAYGYGFDITPLHTLTIYNAVANNGRMVAPRLILRTERNGKVINEAPVRVINEQICSKPTIDTLRSFMEDVSQWGTAAEFFNKEKCGFTSGSKTGTAQVDTKINEVRYTRDDRCYYGSMVTYLPADKPRYTIITAIFTQEQTGKKYYGAALAGPVQKAVATYLHNRDLGNARGIEGGAQHFVTHLKGGNIEKMLVVADQYGGAHQIAENDGWGRDANGGDDRIDITKLEIDNSRIPNVVGMGLNDALYLLERCGLTVEVVGYGKVAKQSIAAGATVAKGGKRIKIELK